MIFKHMTGSTYGVKEPLWEEVPDEDLWEDGELTFKEVQDKIHYHIMSKGDWI